MKFTHNNNQYELLVLTLAGSKLYGNSRPESDTDYRGVFVSSNESKLGLLGTVQQLEGLDVLNALREAGLTLEETDDIVIYELNRFASLALDNNPNIMDILCHDYTQEANIYMSEKGKQLLDAKDLFLSSKLKHTFSGYAISQLKRIKGHNKWINEYPDTDGILKRISHRHKGGYIDFNWICNNFGGQVAEKITGETPQKNIKLDTTDSWYDFCTRYVEDELEFDKYRVPQLINYCTARNLQAKKLDKNLGPSHFENILNFTSDGWNLKNFLETGASFRSLSPSMLTIYTDGKGIFTKEGTLKANDPEKIGDFVCMLQINHMEYKKDKDHLTKMWHWKVNRNEKRGSLEEKFGYDTKHASHLVRLMEGCKDILRVGVYTPELHEERLEFVNAVRNGEYAYDWLIKYSEKLDTYLDELYRDTELQKKPKRIEVNDLILELQKDL